MGLARRYACKLIGILPGAVVHPILCACNGVHSVGIGFPVRDVAARHIAGNLPSVRFCHRARRFVLQSALIACRRHLHGNLFANIRFL